MEYAAEYLAMYFAGLLSGVLGWHRWLRWKTRRPRGEDRDAGLRRYQQYKDDR